MFIVLLAPPVNRVLGGEKHVVSEVLAEALGLHLEGWLYNSGQRRSKSILGKSSSLHHVGKEKHTISGNQPDFNDRYLFVGKSNNFGGKMCNQ